MKRRNLKRTMQRMVLGTQYVPFTSLYRLCYAIAIGFCVRRLRRIRGVRAIYLRRGLVQGRPLYGLSDIDLMVMVEGSLEGKAAALVRHQYDLLRRVVPMLPEPAELEIYNREHFAALSRWSPFYRNRFELGRHYWKRLYGDDVFTDLPPAGDTSRLAWQELRPAWNHLAQEWEPSPAQGMDERSLFVRRYVAYKAIAEAARAALLAQGAGPSLSREVAVLNAATAFPEITDSVKAVLALRKRLLEAEPPPMDVLLPSFLSMARRALAATAEEPTVRRSLRILPYPVAGETVLLDPSAFAILDEACAELSGIEHAVLVPRLSFEAFATLDLAPVELAGATTDAFDLALVWRRLPSAEALRRFNARIATLHPRIAAFLCDGELAVSTRPMKGRAFKDCRNDPEFFAGLRAARPLSAHLEIAGAMEIERPFDLEGALEMRARTLLELFGKPEAFRLPVRSFLALFWEAARAACMAAQARAPEVEVPVSSAQIMEALARHIPSEAPILREIHAEYRKEARGDASQAARYTHWAGQFALLLHERIFLPGSAAIRLPAQARAELKISVTIVTRNRAPMLRNALQSLVGQERPPDQVVVVDNASTDETVAVAQSFSGRLNMTLLHEDRVGIPIARNTSLRHCTGDIVALMDDDCVADKRWLAEIEQPFLRDPHIAAVGGRLAPIEGRRQLIARFYDVRMRAATAAEDGNPS
jgi:hypothetical protein